MLWLLLLLFLFFEQPRFQVSLLRQELAALGVPPLLRGPVLPRVGLDLEQRALHVRRQRRRQGGRRLAPLRVQGLQFADATQQVFQQRLGRRRCGGAGCLGFLVPLAHCGGTYSSELQWP